MVSDLLMSEAITSLTRGPPRTQGEESRAQQTRVGGQSMAPQTRVGGQSMVPQTRVGGLRGKELDDSGHDSGQSSMHTAGEGSRKKKFFS